jgi:CubicO group peptidase (beta-lactamase class C family)
LPQTQQSLPCGDAPGEPGCTWDGEYHYYYYLLRLLTSFLILVFLENIGRRPPVYRPFTTPVYSNVGYAVLGRVIENVSGKTYAEYLEQNIISKARMNRTMIGSPPISNLGFIPAESNWWSTSIGYENP